jgi:hypothetical protein
MAGVAVAVQDGDRFRILFSTIAQVRLQSAEKA